MRTASPRAWIFAGLSDSLGPGQIRSLDIVDSPRVVYRTTRGELVVAAAHCPHLGTHLGQGARIEGERIRCPLHGLRFEPSGACVEDREREGGLCLPIHPSCERAGMIFTWYAPDGRAPDFELPAIDDAGFGPLRIRSERLELAMEEPLEVHAVDIRHNVTLHAELDVEPVEPFSIEGAVTHASLLMRHPATPAGQRILRVLGVRDGHVETHVEVRTVGLGFQHIRSTVERLGIVVNQFMLAVPEGPNAVVLNVVYSMRRLERAKLPGLLRPLPLGLLEPAFDRAGYAELMAATDEHVQMWTRKRQLATPGWMPGDEDLRRYRAWADGFYDNDGPS